jgi:hypothetical protein
VARRAGCVLVALSAATFGAHARAEGAGDERRSRPMAFALRVVPECHAVTPELEMELTRVVAAAPRTELTAAVTIEQSPAGYRVELALRDRLRARGGKAITVPTCSEAADAAVVVLALALSGREVSAAEREPRGEPTGPARLDVAREQERVARAAPEREKGSSPKVRTTRLGLMTGIDAGTLPHATVTVAGTAVRSLPELDLRAVLRYGLPTADETIESDFARAHRSDFGALELLACRGTQHVLHVSACAGAEIGVVRASHTERTEPSSDVDEQRVTPRLSGTLAARFAYLGGLVEPELELAGAAVALGRHVESPWFVVRVAAGAAVTF